MTHRGRIYQPTTIKNLRKLYADNDAKAQMITAEANRLLESAAVHTALARDAATLLAEADPEWTNGDETPANKRAERLKAWREALDVIALHPELSVSGYDSLSLYPADGEDGATPEFVAALEQHGFKVARTETRIAAEMWFGDYTVRLTSSAKIEQPPVAAEPAPEPEAVQA